MLPANAKADNPKTPKPAAVPKIVAVAKPTPAAVKVDADKSPVDKAQSVAKIIKRKPMAKPETSKVIAAAAPVKVKPVSRPKAVAAPRRAMSDITVSRAHTRPVVLPTPKQLPKQSQSVPALPETTPEAISKDDPKPVVHSKPQKLGATISQAWRAASGSKYLLSSYTSGLLSLAPLAGWLIFRSQFSGGIFSQLAAFSVILVSFRLAAYLVKLRLDAGTVYASSKRLDSRPANKTAVAGSATGSLVPLAIIDTLVLLALLVLAVIELAVWFYALPSLPQLPALAIEVASLALVYYLAVSLVISRLLARPAIILGKLGAFRALGLGWKLAHKRLLAVIGAGLVSLLAFAASLAIAVSILLAANAGTVTIPAYASTIIALAVGGFALGIAITLNSGLWLGLFREGVKTELSGQLATLLSGRSGAKSSRMATAGLVIMVVLLLSVTALAIWRPDLIIQLGHSLGVNLPSWR